MYNLHTHTQYCDGSSEPENYVKEALKNGFHTLGFTAHAPVSFENVWSLKPENEKKYFDEIKRLKLKYSNRINILNGLEIDYIPKISKTFQFLRNQYALDYEIGAVHLVKKNNALWFIDGPADNYDIGLKNLFNNNIKEAVETYYLQIIEMIKNESPSIVAHIDKIKMNNKNRYFSEDEQWYKNILDDTLNVLKKNQTIVEVNTRGVYTEKCTSFFPGVYFIEQCLFHDIPITLNSDAHKPNELMNAYTKAIDMLNGVGVKYLTVISENGRKKIEIKDFMPS